MRLLFKTEINFCNFLSFWVNRQTKRTIERGIKRDGEGKIYREKEEREKKERKKEKEGLRKRERRK